MSNTPTTAVNRPLIDIVEIARLGTLAASRVIEPCGKEPVVMVPEGYTLEKLEPKKETPLPDTIRQNVRLDELESFTRYVTDFKLEHSRIFASKSESGAEFQAILDYHNSTEGNPDRAWHRVFYKCPFSREWLIWNQANARKMTQEAFCEFLDANIVDIVAPDSASLLELLRNFEGKASVQFQSDFVRQNGAKVLKYSEVIEGTQTGKAGSVKVPEELVLSLPVFQGGPRFTVKARLMYRVASAALTVWFELHRPHEAIQLAVEDAVIAIEKGTEIRPLIGAPL